ncbi:unnamed protein product [Nippostrongylus brasiliensis]|uniref:G_PROTEIN_RECEP_F1_2 domain-containing protein n=1 Tax=Nippostrongylus brasiliensis TaxID=27835 RepID=A0A158QWK1_NIPBR|nr:unnamed protein product [Nippostrongylus brasiliensis]
MLNSTDPGPAVMLHEPSDYVQMVVFVLFMVIGLPVNLSTLFYMVKRYRHAKSFLLLLHINLNISDILVLGIYLPGLIGWLITLEWKGGAVLCKIMRFTDAFVFSIRHIEGDVCRHSNIMVCIALYRLYALRYPLWISTIGHSRVPRMLLISWGVALITPLPQLYVWREVDFGHFHQCVTKWAEKINLGTNRTEMSDDDILLMKIHSIQSTCTTFYIPLVILVICYFLILKDIYKTLNASEPELSSAWYLSDLSKHSTSVKRISKKDRESASQIIISLSARTLRGQDKLSRAKVRSLRITLLLILVYVITWLPNNLLSWWMVISFDSYRVHQDATFPLSFLVVLNSVINPFIYGR